MDHQATLQLIPDCSLQPASLGRSPGSCLLPGLMCYSTVSVSKAALGLFIPGLSISSNIPIKIEDVNFSVTWQIQLPRGSNPAFKTFLTTRIIYIILWRACHPPLRVSTVLQKSAGEAAGLQIPFCHLHPWELGWATLPLPVSLSPFMKGKTWTRWPINSLPFFDLHLHILI